MGKIKRDFALKRFLSAFRSFAFILQLIALDNVMVQGVWRGDAVGRGTCMTAQGAMTLRAHSALPTTPATLQTNLAYIPDV